MIHDTCILRYYDYYDCDYYDYIITILRATMFRKKNPSLLLKHQALSILLSWIED